MKQKTKVLAGCLILMCLTINKLYGHDEIDSLNQVLKQNIADSTRIKILNRLAEIHIYSNPKYSINLAIEAIDKSKLLPEKKFLATSYNRLGSAYWSLGNLSLGLKYFTEAYEIGEQIDDKDFVARTLGRIALIYSSAGLYSISIEYEKKALNHFIALNNQERMMVLYNNIGKDFLELEQLDSAKIYTLMAYKLMGASKTPSAIIPLKLADIALRENSTKECSYYLDEIYSRALNDNDYRSISLYHQLSAELLMHEAKYDEAYKKSKRSVQLADSIQMMELKFITYKTHSRALSYINQYQEAYQYQTAYIALRDSFKSVRQQNLLTLREFDLKDRELKATKHLEDLAEAEAEYRLIIIIGLGVLLIISILVIWNVNRLRENKNKLNESLLHKNFELERNKIELTQKNNQLNRISVFRDKVLSVLSHDIRGPISSAKSLIELHKRGKINPDEISLFLKELTLKLDVLTGLTATLIAWARTKFDEPIIKYVRFNLKELTEKIISNIESLIHDKNIVIINQVSPESTMKCDIDIIEAVLRNIISNAGKYSSNGGRIWIKCDVVNNHYRVSVKDEGVGIPENVIKILFDHQVDSSKGTADEGGIGIGLMLCRDLLNEVNGKIWAEKNEPKGTAIFMEIPVPLT